VQPGGHVGSSQQHEVLAAVFFVVAADTGQQSGGQSTAFVVVREFAHAASTPPAVSVSTVATPSSSIVRLVNM